MGEDAIPQLHGLRFLSMVWILLLHSVIYSRDFCENKILAMMLSRHILAQTITNGTLSVDTFFFISGLLMVYQYIRTKVSMEKKSRQKRSVELRIKTFIHSLLYRFWRLTPPYMICLGLVAVNITYYRYSSVFPLPAVERDDINCVNHWWRNLLYINNFYPRDDMCMSWSWYLACDMQFFILGNIIMMIGESHFYSAVAVMASVVLGSCISSGSISFMYNYDPRDPSTMYTLADVFYTAPWVRISPYIIGMATAYILLQLRGKLFIRKHLVWIFWSLSSIVNTTVLFCTVWDVIDRELLAVYVAFSRVLWAVCIAWTVVACCTGHGGFVSTILSFKGWVPFSKLTYCAYLLNSSLIMSTFLNGETAVHMNFMMMTSFALGQVVIVYMICFIASMIVEAPFINIGKIIF